MELETVDCVDVPHEGVDNEAVALVGGAKEGTVRRTRVSRRASAGARTRARPSMLSPSPCLAAALPAACVASARTKRRKTVRLIEHVSRRRRTVGQSPGSVAPPGIACRLRVDPDELRR